MTFADLASGDAVFVDANVFVYHFATDPVLQAPCGDLLRRIEGQDLQGFTSTHVVAEAAHRLLTLEARTRFGWTAGKVVQRLKQDPGKMQTLTAFRIAVERMAESRLVILPVSPATLVAAAPFCQRPGLLITDALSVTLMQAQGLTTIASDDADFDRVPSVTRYSPA